jgi:hypothetical protein
MQVILLSLNKFAPTGLSAQAYPTANGVLVFSLQTTTLLFSKLKLAQITILSIPTIEFQL